MEHAPPEISTAAGRRIVVTGAAGFIGSSLVDALVSRGHTVVGIDRRDEGAANLADADRSAQFAMVRTDIAKGALDPLVRGADTVFHLAAVPGVRDSWGSGFEDYVRSNIVATQRLLAACEAAGVRRLVYASSSSVYGNVTAPSCESDPTDPISPYGVTKLAAERLCVAHARRPDTGLSVVALRYFTVFGPRQRPGMAINRILAACLAGSPLPLYGDGSQRREFTYIDDVVAATLAAAEIDVDSAAVVNIGGGTSAAMREVIALAEQITGRPAAVVAMPEQAGDVAVTRADHRQARRLLGYRPSVSLREGMERQTDWLSSLPDVLRASGLPNRMEVVR